jgi:Protein of unknown function (DUF2917)
VLVRIVIGRRALCRRTMQPMNTTSMTSVHELAAPGFALARGQVTRLAAARERRLLWVQQGRIWATRTNPGNAASAHDRAEDQWLASGETLDLPPGSDWVIEPWPAARVGVLLALPSSPRAAGAAPA